MGVHNTQNPRVTLYLKKEHVQFLKNVTSNLSEGTTRTSSSELVRAILDMHCGISDWKTEALISAIEKVKEKEKSK